MSFPQHNPAPKTSADSPQNLPETGESAGAEFGKVPPPPFETVLSISLWHEYRFEWE